MRIAIDRFEGGHAIVEIAGHLVEIPIALVPPEAREGSLLKLVMAEPASEQAILDAARERLERLSKTGPSGDDIEL